MKRETHVSSLMVADPRLTQPRCEVASRGNGMLLSLEVNFGKRFEAKEPQRNIVPFRMWLGRGILITARGHHPEEGELRLPSWISVWASGRRRWKEMLCSMLARYERSATRRMRIGEQL